MEARDRLPAPDALPFEQDPEEGSVGFNGGFAWRHEPAGPFRHQVFAFGQPSVQFAVPVREAVAEALEAFPGFRPMAFGKLETSDFALDPGVRMRVDYPLDQCRPGPRPRARDEDRLFFLTCVCMVWALFCLWPGREESNLRLAGCHPSLPGSASVGCWQHRRADPPSSGLPTPGC